jgi:hypothetical protein
MSFWAAAVWPGTEKVLAEYGSVILAPNVTRES